MVAIEITIVTFKAKVLGGEQTQAICRLSDCLRWWFNMRSITCLIRSMQFKNKYYMLCLSKMFS